MSVYLMLSLAPEHPQGLSVSLLVSSCGCLAVFTFRCWCLSKLSFLFGCLYQAQQKSMPTFRAAHKNVHERFLNFFMIYDISFNRNRITQPSRTNKYKGFFSLEVISGQCIVSLFVNFSFECPAPLYLSKQVLPRSTCFCRSLSCVVLHVTREQGHAVAGFCVEMHHALTLHAVLYNSSVLIDQTDDEKRQILIFIWCRSLTRHCSML